MTRGRPKGARAELEVAEIVRAWWASHEPGAVFKRTPGSGGWAKGDGREKFGTAGDLVTDSPSFPFSIEVKRREGWSWDRLFAGKASPVWKWWRQAVEQAEEMSLTPALWFRHNREEWHVMVPQVVLWRMVDVRRPPARFFVALAPRVVAGIHPAITSASRFLSLSPRDWIDACVAYNRFES